MCNLLSKHLQFSVDLINYETFYIPSSSVFSVSPFIEETISSLENTRLAIYLDNQSQELLLWKKRTFIRQSAGVLVRLKFRSCDIDLIF